MRILTVLDLYINTCFQLFCNTVRSYGVRVVALLVPVHALALYYFLTSAARQSVAGDLLGTVMACYFVIVIGIAILRCVIDMFRIWVGDGDAVDADRREYQDNTLRGKGVWIRPIVLGASLAGVLFVGDSASGDVLLFQGLFLFCVGQYFESCV